MYNIQYLPFWIEVELRKAVNPFSLGDMSQQVPYPRKFSLLAPHKNSCAKRQRRILNTTRCKISTNVAEMQPEPESDTIILCCKVYRYVRTR